MKRWVTWATVWVLVSCVTPVFSQWLPGQEPQKSAMAAKADDNKAEIRKIFFVPPEFDKKVEQAIQNGDLDTVKYWVEKHPWKLYLTSKIYDNNEKLAHPVCVAAKNGYVDILQYMHKKMPGSLLLECEEGNAFDAAIVNKKVDAATLLANFKVPTDMGEKPPFVIVAQSITDFDSLKKIIPALLNSGAQVADINVDMSRLYNGDAWYEAAEINNVNFVTVLQRELKKRGQDTAVSEIKIRSCLGWTPEDAKRWEKSLREKTSGQFLTQHNVEISFYVEATSIGCD